MSTRIRQIKRSLNSDLRNLESARKQLGKAGSKNNKSVSLTLLRVQKSLHTQQLRLNFILDLLAFHKAKRVESERTTRSYKAKSAELEKKVSALKARLQRDE